MPKRPVNMFIGEWSEPMERALYLIFEGQKQRSDICAELNIPRGTLEAWLRHPEFQARLAELRARLSEQLEGVAFLQKEQRLLALSKLATQARDEWENHRYLVEQRPVPGGTMINESLNKGAADIMRGCLDDIARELGERVANVKLTGKVEKQQTVVINVVDVPEDIKRQYLLTKDDKQPDIVEAGNATMIAGPVNQVDDEDEDDEGI